jgi:hypothetical protein
LEHQFGIHLKIIFLRLFQFGASVSRSGHQSENGDHERSLRGRFPDANSVALFWCMIKQNQIEQVIVLNEPAPDEAIFLPEQCEKMIYNGITVSYLREYYMKNSKIISCGLENVRERFFNIVLIEKNGCRVETEKWSTSSS